jgi:hypothetical protein
MTRERPLSILIIALLSFGVAGLGIFTGTAAMAKQVLFLVVEPANFGTNPVFAGQPRLPDMPIYLDRELPEKSIVDLLTHLESFLGGVVLLAVCVGLLHMRAWARWVGLLYGLVTLFWHIGFATFQIVYVLPLIEGYYLDPSWRWSYVSGSGGSLKVGFFFFLLIQVGVFAAHALAMLVVLALPSTTAAFAGKPVAEEIIPSVVEGSAAAAVSSV